MTLFSAIKNVLLEALLVVLGGWVFALLANSISPRGLRLTRNYFPAVQLQAPGRAAPSAASGRNEADQVPSDTQLLAARLRENGLQLIEYAQVKEMVRQPAVKPGQVLLVDARDEESYRAGHIPGAYEFDPYHADKYLASILPLCQKAQRIVVYCNGGDCEDSEFAAISLRDAGIPGAKLFVYGGGITEWNASGEGLEKGARETAGEQ